MKGLFPYIHASSSKAVIVCFLEKASGEETERASSHAGTTSGAKMFSNFESAITSPTQDTLRFVCLHPKHKFSCHVKASQSYLLSLGIEMQLYKIYLIPVRTDECKRKFSASLQMSKGQQNSYCESLEPQNLCPISGTL